METFQIQKQKYNVSENGKIVGSMSLTESDAEQMRKNGLNLSRQMTIKYKQEFQSPYANSASEEGNVGLAYELEDDWTEEGTISNKEAWRRENKRYARIAQSEEFGLGFVEG